MTDAEREAQKLSRPTVLPDCMMPDGAEPCGGYKRLREVIEGQGLSMASMTKELAEARAEIARLRAPPEADVMEIVKAIRRRVNQGADWALNYTEAGHALTAYGDQRLQEGDKEASAQYPRWAKEYGDQRAREARAAAIEEAAQRVRERDEARAETERHPWYGPCDALAPGGECAECLKIREINGHDEPCLICLKPCNTFAGNPSLWPVRLGNDGWHHVGCLNDALRELERLRAPPEADVMKRAGSVFDEVVALLFDGTRPKPYLRPDAIIPIAAYGDQRARDDHASAIETIQKIVAKYEENGDLGCPEMMTEIQDLAAIPPPSEERHLTPNEQRVMQRALLRSTRIIDDPPQSGWRGIASAPRNGTVVIIPGGCGYCIDGVWKSWQNHRPLSWEVKWWMPLPAPPQSEGGEP